jgi:hypothetical protein
VENDAREAILALGGSLSHHHGVGKHRQKWLPSQARKEKKKREIEEGKIEEDNARNVCLAVCVAPRRALSRYKRSTHTHTHTHTHTQITHTCAHRHSHLHAGALIRSRLALPAITFIFCCCVICVHSFMLE